MRILYYLEPQEELGKPLFRLPTVRNLLDREIRGLLQSAPERIEVGMLCSAQVAEALRSERLVERAQLFTIDQAAIKRVYPSYLEASASFYNRSAQPAQLQRMEELCSQAMGGFVPDVIICWESNAPFLETLFPRALFLHSTFGIFSRAPYPETSSLDPFGIGKDSFLARYGAQLRGLTLSAAEQQQLDGLKNKLRAMQTHGSPVQRAEVCGRFERTVLLPLQVSSYFMYDENCPGELKYQGQRALVRYVLERTDPKVGVYVTLHEADAKLFDDGVRRDLSREFPNLLFSPELQRIRWVSQHCLPHVDAVVTVSSSIGLQALIWDLPVVALGRSHITGVAASRSLSDLTTLLNAGRTTQLDAALYYLLTHYYPLMERYHHRGDWLVPFVKHGIEQKRRGLDFSFYAPIDTPNKVLDGLAESARPELYAQEVRSSLPRTKREAGSASATILASIGKADLVSFDVFDTLVTRPLIDPRAVFDLVAPEAVALLLQHGVPLSSAAFRSAREEAAVAAAEQARAAGREEYELIQLYRLLCARCGASETLAEQLGAIEERVELAITRPRDAGRALFDEARRLGKRIVLISDIFFEPRLVAAVLQRCGYDGYAKLYVSSQYGLLKRSGNLYKHVAKEEGQPTRWVHVGDNLRVDVRVPARLGIESFHLPSSSEQYAADRRVAQLWERRQLDKSLGANLQHGVISRRFYDQPDGDARGSRFAGSAYRLGFEAGGPLLLSFVLWLAHEARRHGRTDLYFLARDGALPMQIYELLAKLLPGLPRAHYLYASRRAFSVPALHNSADIIASLENKNSATKLGILLQDRLALPAAQVVPGSLGRAGFQSLDDVVALARPEVRARLNRLLEENSSNILARAAEEREVLEGYLRSEGLFDTQRNAAVVDLGHNGSLQVALSRLLGRPDLGGYYFATFFPAYKSVLAGFSMDSYLLAFEESEISQHVYCQNVGLFEFLFLPPQATLLRMEARDDGTFAPVFVPGDESKRIAIAEQLHRGVLDFCREVLEGCAGQPLLFQVSRNDALRTFAHYAEHPDRADAAIVDGVSFVDFFGGVPARYLIATPMFSSIHPANYARFEAASWWKPGARAMAGATSRFRFKANGAPWQRKLNKLMRDPRAFVQDMRLMRSLEKLLQDRARRAR